MSGHPQARYSYSGLWVKVIFMILSNEKFFAESVGTIYPMWSGKECMEYHIRHDKFYILLNLARWF
jgi:hypothetical protein